ncbi:YdbH domain-containing protein [bacterium]|nr:YdbH domain-containing protein [bacterium]
MKKLLIIFLFLVILLSAGVYWAFKNPKFFLKNVEGLEVGELSLSIKPLGIRISEAAYTNEALSISAESAVVRATVSSFKGLREKDPEALFLDLFLSNAFIRISREEEEGGEAEKKNWEELIRVPFLFKAQVDGLKTDLGGDIPELSLSGRLSNAYEGNHYSLTGAFHTVLEGAAVDLEGGIKGNVLDFRVKGDIGREFLPFLGLKSETVVLDGTTLSLDFTSRLDWKKLRNAYASEIPEAITNVRSEVRGRIRNLDALSGKIAITNLTLRADLVTENFLRERSSYSSSASWLFHAFKGGFDCACSAIELNDLAPHVIEFGPSKAQTYMKSNGLVLSNLVLNTLRGQLSGWSEISSRKIKGQDDYLPWVEFDLKTAGLDVGLFCDLFDLKQNRMDGQLNGELHTAIFGKYVKALNGKFYASDKGTFTLGKAESYLQGMEEGYSKDLVGILAERLKKYPYKKASVELGYENKVTKVTIDLEGANDNSHIKLPISIHSSWLELLDLAKQFK